MDLINKAMRAKEFMPESEFKALSGQMSAMGSNKPDPHAERRKRAKKAVEDLFDNPTKLNK